MKVAHHLIGKTEGLTRNEGSTPSASVTLTLPLPDSPNRKRAHPMAEHRRKNEYRLACWIEAVQQALPKAERDLPAKVRITPTLYVKGLRRDDDNAAASMKFPLDCLKLRQKGSVFWRFGLYDEKGYFIDDDPDHCEVMKPLQVVDRKNPRLVVVIEPVEGV